MAERAPHALATPALLALAGGACSFAVGLLMRPELPPLLADWPLRDATLALVDGGADAPAAQALALALFAAAMALGVAAAALAWRRRARLGAGDSTRVLLVTAALLALGLLSPPRWSSDAFLYAYYGKIAAVHGANPYALPGRAFARSCALPAAPHRVATPGRPCRSDAHCPPPSRCLIDPFVPYQSWLEVRAAYGPLALAAFEALYVKALPPEANAALLRAAAALAFLLLVALVCAFAGPGAGAVLGWLPLGATVSANGGHLEAFVALLVLAALAATARANARSGPGDGALALLALAAAVGALAAIKLHLGALALPCLAGVARRRGVGAAAAVALAATAMVALGYAAYWVDPHPFGGLADVADTSIRTPLDLIRRVAQALGQRGDLAVSRPLFALGWLALVGAALARLWRAPADEADDAALLAATLTVFVATTALASGIFHPWYALPGLAVAACALARPAADGAGALRATLWLAIAAPVLVDGAWLALGPAAFAAPWVVAPTALIFAPALALWALSGRRTTPGERAAP